MFAIDRVEAGRTGTGTTSSGSFESSDQGLKAMFRVFFFLFLPIVLDFKPWEADLIVRSGEIVGAFSALGSLEYNEGGKGADKLYDVT
jgi:hypothetical protein